MDGVETPAQREAAAAEATVMVRFFTTVMPQQMPDTPFNIPVSTRPKTLSDLVNSVLGMSPPARLLFLHDGRLLTCSLRLHMQRRGISAEQILELEYTPSLGEKDQAKIPVDDWVSAVRAFPRHAPFVASATAAGASGPLPSLVLTGSYDTLVRLVDPALLPTLPPPPPHGTPAAALHHAELPSRETLRAQAEGSIVAVGRAHRGPVKAVASLPNAFADALIAGPATDALASAPTCVSVGMDGLMVLWRVEATGKESAAASKKRRRGGATVEHEHPGKLVAVGISEACDGGASSVAISALPGMMDGNALIALGGANGSVVVTTLEAALATAKAAGGEAAAEALAATGGLPSTKKGLQSRGAGGLGAVGAGVFERAPHFAAGESHPRSVEAVAFSPSAPGVLISAGLDGDVRLWDCAGAGPGTSMKPPRITRGATVGSGVFCLATSTDSASDLYRTVVAGHADHRVRVWDPRSSAPVVRTWHGHGGWVYDVATDPLDHRRLISTGEDGAICVWDVRSSLPLHKIAPHAAGCGILGGAWVGNAIASGGKDKFVSIVTLN